MESMGFYESDFGDKLDFSESAFFPDNFGGLEGDEDSIDFSAFLNSSQNEPSVLPTTVVGRQVESFPTLGNLDNLFVGQQMQSTYSTILPSTVKQEPVDVSYSCESSVSSPNNQSETMPQQNFYNNLHQPSMGLTGNDNIQSPYVSQASSPTSTTSSCKATPASKTLSKSAKRQRQVPEKGTHEYLQKREKNNVAVRKSREKSKKKAVQLQDKVKQLTDENDRLNKKVELLTKELSVLKQLFTNVGKQVPHELKSC
ncbi:CCAAT/enhancer-binding protein beta-like [Anneissia japonica]|uniref:CCAAT/enhancer-binding protein beta-like n=1 Tax=Anneissia japonica TaxID=1529436 RepID=UPI00142552ED|nr:CCAAT/enhancer-binding protein beta-like [Anneissia japonica]